MNIESLDVTVCRLPTENGPESDGTAVWDTTTMVIVEVRCDGATGLGYTYETDAAAAIVRDVLAPSVIGADPDAIPATRARMLRAIRNFGRAGVVACAISAVDVALWDLRSRLVGRPLATVLGVARERVPVYASGGFTSTQLDALAREVEEYVAQGHTRVKIKVGREPARDPDRVRVLAEAAGHALELMVDANGAYSPKQALEMAERFAARGVRYFEEPVSSDDLDGMRFVRERAPMPIAAGEYGYDAAYFRHMLDAGAVDLLQADATRCLGITGFLDADTLCDVWGVPLSAHCAPAIHVHAGAAARRLVHIEYFRDHARMERLLFEGLPSISDGAIAYDSARAGLGLELRHREAARLAA